MKRESLKFWVEFFRCSLISHIEYFPNGEVANTRWIPMNC